MLVLGGIGHGKYMDRPMITGDTEQSRIPTVNSHSKTLLFIIVFFLVHTYLKFIE